MKQLGTYKKVQFDTIKELKNFMRGGEGDVYYWDDWQGEYVPLVWDDEEKNLCLGYERYLKVTSKHLTNIYGYNKVI